VSWKKVEDEDCLLSCFGLEKYLSFVELSRLVRVGEVVLGAEGERGGLVLEDKMSSDRDREEREYGDRYSDEKYDDADGGGRKDEEETEDREARDEREDREGNGSADQMEEELAVYVGNFEYRTTTRDLERLFERFGSVKKVDMKVGRMQ